MKKYIATFWRGNPQLKDGGYETTREIEAVSITSARKKARDIEDGCVYGSMSLLSIEKEAVNESGKITAYKKVIDGLIFVSPRMIPICFSGEMSECQRPLRAQTAQGERVSLANSEQIPAGSTCEFEVLCMDDSHEKAVREWLDYGVLRGIGQWRNSGKGRFTYEVLD